MFGLVEYNYVVLSSMVARMPFSAFYPTKNCTCMRVVSIHWTGLTQNSVIEIPFSVYKTSLPLQ